MKNLKNCLQCGRNSNQPHDDKLHPKLKFYPAFPVEEKYYHAIILWLWQNHGAYSSGKEWRKEFDKFLKELFNQ